MKFQAISIIFIIAIVSVSLLIQSCKSSLFGYVTVSGTVLSSCSGNPVSNEIVSLVKYGSRGGTETTSTNSSGYFNFKTLSTGDGVDELRARVEGRARRGAVEVADSAAAALRKSSIAACAAGFSTEQLNGALPASWTSSRPFFAT